MIHRVLRKVKNSIFKIISVKRNIFLKSDDLIIIDDIFPHLLSGFRVAEFNYYLENISNCKVYSSANAFKWIHETRSFNSVKKEHGTYYPLLTNKIIKYNGQKLKAKLFYFTFLRNTFESLAIVNKYKTPFIFTLYPGGNFRLNHVETDLMLKAIFSNPYFRKVIVTSKATLYYLKETKLCPEEKIHIIYGVVIQSNLFNLQSKKLLPQKQTFDICFVAHKYTPMGKDKGYNIFIETAKILAKLYPNIYFHVVGNFNETDMDVSFLLNRIKFYGTLNTQQLSSFYMSKDIILSPNASFILSAGAFDGFPTGACIEAGLNGVALFISDDLNQNVFFQDKENVVLINNIPLDISKKVEYYYHNNDKLIALAEVGREKIELHYNLETQMLPRVNLIKKELANIS